ncbi:hypothetical protein CGRA01v4_14487 [Colletotrichum graminicola]|nr:hypothetical protein CGRA01v4_14487 [Colletotrichum graminicola]
MSACHTQPSHHVPSPARFENRHVVISTVDLLYFFLCSFFFFRSDLPLRLQLKGFDQGSGTGPGTKEEMKRLALVANPAIRGEVDHGVLCLGR